MYPAIGKQAHRQWRRTGLLCRLDVNHAEQTAPATGCSSIRFLTHLDYCDHVLLVKTRFVIGKGTQRTIWNRQHVGPIMVTRNMTNSSTINTASTASRRHKKEEELASTISPILTSCATASISRTQGIRKEKFPITGRLTTGHAMKFVDLLRLDRGIDSRTREKR